MLKVSVIVCAIAAAGTLVCVKSSAYSKETAAVPGGMHSIEDLHPKARAHDLPVQQIGDLY